MTSNLKNLNLSKTSLKPKEKHHFHLVDNCQLPIITARLLSTKMLTNHMSMKTHFKQPENKQSAHYIDNLQLKKPIKRVWLTNIFLITLTIINSMIVTYFYTQQDIIFSATGWLHIPEKIHWYQIFLALIALRIIIVFIIQQLTQYIKDFLLWTEKQKKNAINTLAFINLLTFPINLPLIGTFIAYLKGNEILSNNWFLGTFRRVLNENERENLYNVTVNNFLDKIEDSKEIKDKLKTWASENTKSMLEKYDDGSDFATEYISGNLEIQKDVLQLEETQKLYQDIKIVFKEQTWPHWIYHKTYNGIYNGVDFFNNYFNPFVTDYKTCVTSWSCVLLAIAAGLCIGIVAKSYFVSANEIKSNNETIKALTKGLAAQDRKINVDKRITDQVLRQIVDDVNLVKADLRGVENIVIRQVNGDIALTRQIREMEFINTAADTKITNISRQMGIVSDAIDMKIISMDTKINNMDTQIDTLNAKINTIFLTQQKKDEILTRMSQKYGNQSPPVAMFLEMFKDFITQL